MGVTLALAELPSQAPDVVLMDINLPGMSGIERVRRLRALIPAAQVMMVIAASLGISINTVRRHIMAIYDELHVNSRLEAVGKLGRI